MKKIRLLALLTIIKTRFEGFQGSISKKIIFQINDFHSTCRGMLKFRGALYQIMISILPEETRAKYEANMEETRGPYFQIIVKRLILIL